MHDICSVIAEYNPFHEGHRYHLEQAKKLTHTKYTAVILSSDFVQRGEPAVFSKFARARAAVHNGADIVFELPVQYSCAPAWRFASGAVRIADAIGSQWISFGSESGGAGLEAPDEEDGEYRDRLKASLKEGNTYAKALASASGEDLMPNDILAREYMRAIRKAGSGIIPVPVKRESSLHDGTGSALEIRNRIKNGEKYSFGEDFKEEIPVFSEDIFAPLMIKIRSLAPEILSGYAEVGEGLENRIVSAAGKAKSYDELLFLVKSKRYPASRIKRIFINILLDITKELDIKADEEPAALRVLAVNKERREILSLLGDSDIITNPVSSELTAVRTTVRATDIYSVFRGGRSGEDMTNDIIV